MDGRKGMRAEKQVKEERQALFLTKNGHRITPRWVQKLMDRIADRPKLSDLD